MKKIVYLTMAAIAFAACNKKSEITDSGIEYTILFDDENERMVQKGDMLLVNLRMAAESNDSVLLETFSTNSPRYIPADDPSLSTLFYMLSKGDSVDLFLSADTLFQKTFGTKTPESFKAGERIHFVIKLVDVFTQEEIAKKENEQVDNYKRQDDSTLSVYVSQQANVQKTASGLMYIVVEPGKGKQAKKGDKVSMLYTGYLLNGDVFDENQNREKPFEFSLGLGQVIPGWDEGVAMMKEGGKYKFIIPWNLAYGDQNVGPIAPYSSLVFDVEMVKVN